MYILRDMFDLAKLASKYFKAKFEPDLVRIILPFFKKILTSNLYHGKYLLRLKNQFKPKNNIVIKTKKNLVSKEGPPDIQALLWIIFSFFNFSCSSYICLGIKDARVIGLSFISKEYLFVTLSYIGMVYQATSD